MALVCAWGGDSARFSYGMGNKPPQQELRRAGERGRPPFVLSCEREKKDLSSITPADVHALARRYGVQVDRKAFLGFFRIAVREEGEAGLQLGCVQGFVKPSLRGPPILHLDTIRLAQAARRGRGPVFGLGFLLGAAAISYGFEYGCAKAELLAINDTETYHSKLVRYYTRLGFKSVYEVMGDSLQDIPHMLVWGGVGTRMDADLKELMLKWSPALGRQRRSNGKGG